MFSLAGEEVDIDTEGLLKEYEVQQKRDTYKLEEWWHNHFFPQVFTFCHSFTCFTVFHQFVISLTIILQRQLHFFWHSTLSAWPGQDGEVCDVVGWQSPNHPGREGQASRKPCKIAALRLWLFFSSDFLMFFLIFYSLCWGNASVARVSQGRSAAWIMAESGLL